MPSTLKQATQTCAWICMPITVSHCCLGTRTDPSNSATGIKWVNMAQAISTNQIYEYPTITADRSSIHVINPSGSNIPAVTTAVNMWNVHGMILTFSVVLNFFGVLLIRSGFKSVFREHWMVQALSALGMLVGCLIGVLKNTNVFQVCDSRP